MLDSEGSSPPCKLYTGLLRAYAIGANRVSFSFFLSVDVNVISENNDSSILLLIYGTNSRYTIHHPEQLIATLIVSYTPSRPQQRYLQF